MKKEKEENVSWLESHEKQMDSISNLINEPDFNPEIKEERDYEKHQRRD